MTDIFEFEASYDHNQPLQAIIMGQTTTGKSSVIGTYSGKNIMYITTSEESHGAQQAMAMNNSLAAQGKVKKSRFVHINLGQIQAADIKLGLIPPTSGFKVGDEMPASAQKKKMDFYLDHAKSVPNLNVVAVDSLTSLYEVFKATPEVQQGCLTKQGKIDTWAVYGVADTMYTQLIQKLDVLNSKGMDTLGLVLAKLENYQEAEGGIIMPRSFTPDLPSVNMARGIRAKFQTSLFMFRHPSIGGNTPFFHFGIRGAKTSHSRDTGGILNHFEVDLRVQYLPVGYSLDKLPADLENLKANITKFAKPPVKQEPTQKGK